MRRYLYLLVGLMAMTGLAQLAAADGYGTANLPTAEPWQSSSVLVSGEARFWEGNQTWAARARTRVGEDMDAELTLFTMSTSGEDPIAGAVRDSEMTLLGASFKWLAWQNERVTISVIPGLEVPLGDAEGTNTAIPATAVSDDVIPVLSVPAQFAPIDGIVPTAVLRYVGFEESPRVVGGGTVTGFGDTLALGGSLYRRDGQYALWADLQCVLSGDNSIDERTSRVTDEIVWSVGASWFSAPSWKVDLFATTAAGPTAATSLLGAPDGSIAIGIGASGEF